MYDNINNLINLLNNNKSKVPIEEQRNIDYIINKLNNIASISKEEIKDLEKILNRGMKDE